MSDRSGRRSRAGGALLVLVAAGAAAGEAPPAVTPSPQPAAAPTSRWPLRSAVTTVALHPAMLAALGVELAAVEPSAPGHAAHPLSVAAPRAPSFSSLAAPGLAVLVAEEAFAGFTGDTLRHHGGLRLLTASGPIDLSGVVLRPGQPPTSLELLDSTGQAVLVTAQPQWELAPLRGGLRYFNADLRVLPALARRLGDERWAGATLGVLALDAEVLALPAAPPPSPPPIAKGAAPPPCGDWSGAVDVALIGIDSVSQAGSAQNGRVVVVPSVTLKNVGTANVPWYSKLSGAFPPYGNDQHPFLVWQMLRAHDGVLAPLGRSDLKHAFATGNTNCQPGACSTNSHILGLGCEDLYGFSSNTHPSALGPRHEVTASTGIWAHCDTPQPATPSHFDPDGDCDQDHFGSFGDYHDHGMTVAEAALGAAGARFFVEAFYVVRDDVDVWDSLGSLEVVPSFADPLWTFAPAGFAGGPALDRWVDPATTGPGAANHRLATGEGHLQLAMRVSELGGGRRRFAYALQNHDFDRRIRRFRVPFDARAGVSAIAFADGDATAGNDWTASADAGGITWTAPPGTTPPAELDWGSLLAFHFESDQPAAPGTTLLGVGEPGLPGALRLDTLVPASGVFADDFEAGDLSAWEQGP